MPVMKTKRLADGLRSHSVMPQTERKTLSQSNMVFHVKKRVRNQDAVYDVTILVSVHSEEAEKKNGKFKD